VLSCLGYQQFFSCFAATPFGVCVTGSGPKDSSDCWIFYVYTYLLVLRLPSMTWIFSCNSWTSFFIDKTFLHPCNHTFQSVYTSLTLGWCHNRFALYLYLCSFVCLYAIVINSYFINSFILSDFSLKCLKSIQHLWPTSPNEREVLYTGMFSRHHSCVTAKTNCISLRTRQTMPRSDFSNIGAASLEPFVTASHV